jgi:hypothetical protein
VLIFNVMQGGIKEANSATRKLPMPLAHSSSSAIDTTGWEIGHLAWLFVIVLIHGVHLFGVSLP